MPAIVTAIHVADLKGARPRSLSQAVVATRGIVGDHRFMLTTPEHRAVTQRELGRLATISTERGLDGKDDWLTLSHEGRGFLRISKPGEGRPVEAKLFKDTVTVLDQGDAAAAALMEFFGVPLRLTYMPYTTTRQARFQTPGGEKAELCALHDRHPFSIIDEETYAAFVEMHGQDIGIDRFRPTIVVRGAGRFGEESWRRVRIGDVVFHCMRRCSRCQVPSINQGTGIMDTTLVLDTLKRRGQQEKGRLAVQANHQNVGSFRLGNTVEILETGGPYYDT